MGQLADLAKTALKGPVTVTDLEGTQRTFASVTEAEKALVGVDLEYRRGGFFYKAAPKVAPPEDANDTASRPTKKSAKSS